MNIEKETEKDTYGRFIIICYNQQGCHENVMNIRNYRTGFLDLLHI